MNKKKNDIRLYPPQRRVPNRTVCLGCDRYRRRRAAVLLSDGMWRAVGQRFGRVCRRDLAAAVR